MTKEVQIESIIEYLRCPLRYFAAKVRAQRLNNTDAFKIAISYLFKRTITMSNLKSSTLPSFVEMQKFLWTKWQSLNKKPKNIGVAVFANSFISNIIDFHTKFKEQEKITGFNYNFIIENHSINGTVDIVLRLGNGLYPIYQVFTDTPDPITRDMKILSDIYGLYKTLKIEPKFVLFYNIITNKVIKRQINLDINIIKEMIENIAKQYVEQRLYTINSELCTYCNVCDRIDRGDISVGKNGDVIVIHDKTKENKDIVLTDNIPEDQELINKLKEEKNETD